MENSFNMCNLCNIPLVMKHPRPGQTFKPFMGCPNYKQHPPKIQQATPQPQNRPTKNETKMSGDLIIIERLDAINARLDEFGKYLKSKLG